MARVHSLTILELGDDGKFHVVLDRVIDAEILMRADRSIASQAGQNQKQAQGTSAGFGAQAQQISSSMLPTLERQAQGQGTGLTPLQRNQAMVSSQEATGGTNAGLKGEANLASARTRSAGGFSAALDEAARQKMRQQATATQNVNTESTALANQQQQNALRQLQGLYGTNTSGQLQAMGLENQDLATQLAANRQGWLQNTEQGVNTLTSPFRFNIGGGGGGGSQG